MIRRIFIVSLALFFLPWAPMKAAYSTAGQIAYDAAGNPLPVKDPAIVGSAPLAASPGQVPENVKTLPKKIDIDLSEQSLSYYYGDHLVNTVKISGGLAKTPTPIGTFRVQHKIPVKAYAGRNTDGSWYYLPNTKWNLKFLSSGYYIHGAYWHNNFGRPMSHGCVNVSYADMPQLYEFADVGTLITIHK